MVAVMLLSIGAWAMEPPTCPPEADLADAARWARSISLDVRGVVPSVEELSSITGAEVPEALVDAWLESPAFAERVVRHHRSLLWNNIRDQRLVNSRNAFTTTSGVHWIRDRASAYRGDGTLYCGDFEATFDADGSPIPVDLGDGRVQEGWVRVSPYWAPDTEVQVCAFEAQEASVSPAGASCGLPSATSDPGCGCGPDLQWCVTTNVQTDIVNALSDDIDARVRRVVREDLPWTEVLTGRVGYVNGPLVHFYKHLAQLPASVRLDLPPLASEELPNLPYAARELVPFALPEGHSGVLTAPGFLLRFQTNRARANRVYTAFLCQPFQPPDNGIAIDPNAAQTDDLTRRAGCDYCHALLEPAAAHWGRWTELGAGYLDPALYPDFNPLCYDCSVSSSIDCPDICDRYYVVRPLTPELDAYVGWLHATQFLTPEQFVAIDEGPAALVSEGIIDGRLQQCAAENAAQWLLGRPVHAADAEAIAGWADALVGGGWSYRELVRAIVLSESYGRVP